MLTGKKFNTFISLLYIALASIIICAVSIIVFSPFIPKTVTLQLGEITTETIFSPRHIEFESQIDVETNKQKYISIKEKTINGSWHF